MKILLTHGYFLKEDMKEKAIMRPYVPLGILYISAYLEQNNYDNEVFDSTFASYEILCETILNQRPYVLGIYTNLVTKINVLRIIHFVKNHPHLTATKIVLGGPEVRNHVEKFLNYGADFIVLGEGEQTMHELVEWLDEKNSNALTTVDGIAYKNEKNEIYFNRERIKIKNLDELPLPNRRKVNLQLYLDAWEKHHGTNAISVSTMRGCPYTCKWCSRAVYGQSYRRRSAGNVVNEMIWIKEHYDVDSIWFVDDVFTISHKWLEEFMKEIKKRNVQLKFECITRADRMNENVIRNLKESGCFRVWIGAESGSQKVIDLMERRVEVGQVRDMIRLSRKHGLQAGTFIMVGYPGETVEDIYQTVDHLKESNPDLYTITVAYPIKGTALYQEVEEKFVTQLPWESSTDRDIDFKRTYNRKFYDYVIKMINYEVLLHKALKKPLSNLFRLPVLKFKSAKSKSQMLLQQWKRVK